ncbi:hypothetical protein [Lactococcus garvieae]|uniref:Lipoprotein n=1 Tax=Lactococcus garvieae (strain Lg2) TaxID=420890 RepID=F9VDI3_LACGL|nr:hypothetical protein [Lactococcus garvieae]BAK60384.1 conserved hypothetical protein [Lactococcus garvieae Lg2]
MKTTKLASIVTLSAASIFLLAACANNNDSAKGNNDAKTEQSDSSKSADAFTGATAGANSFEDLQKGLSKNGSWLAAITKDMDASGKTLTVEGVYASKNQITRKLAAYAQDDNHVVTDRYTLTVDKVEVKSPGFKLSNGTIKGDVAVFAPGFGAQSGKGVDGKATIDGNLTFASQDLMDAYNKLPEEQKPKVTGETKVVEGKVLEFPMGAITIGEHGEVTHEFEGNGPDTQTGATTGTDAADKDITVDGIFMNENGQIQRTLALIAQNDKHQVTDSFTLTTKRLIIKSPGFDLEGGNIKGDVYVAENASIKARDMKGTDGKTIPSEINGNLYFATQEQLDAYKALDAANQFKVSGEVAVKTAE